MYELTKYVNIFCSINCLRFFQFQISDYLENLSHVGLGNALEKYYDKPV